MATIESSGSPLDAKSDPSGDPPADPAVPQGGGGGSHGSGGEGLTTLEQVVSIATRAAAAAMLAAMKELVPDERWLSHIGPSRAATAPGKEGYGPGRAVLEAQRLRTEGSVTDEEYDAPPRESTKDPLSRLIATERSRMILINQLLGALDAVFDEQHDTHLEANRLSPADPSMIVVLLRKMVGRIIERLDPIHVDPLVEGLAQPPDRRPARTPTSRGSSAPRRGKGTRVSGRSVTAMRVGRKDKASAAAVRPTRRRKGVRR